MTKSERNPNDEIRTMRRAPVRFGGRISAFVRISDFGLRVSCSFFRQCFGFVLNAYLDTADERIGRIGDHTIGRRDTAGDFDRLAEISTDLNGSQLYYPI